MEDLTNVLIAASQANQEAEARLNDWVDADYADFVKALATEIATDGKPLQSRIMASIYLKNKLYAKSPDIQQECHDRWKRLDAGTRQHVRDTLLSAIRSTDQGVPHYAALAIAEVACIELLYNDWPGFVQVMTENLTQQAQAQPEPVQLACLECLGFTCERIEAIKKVIPDVPILASEIVNGMLTTIVHGVQADKSDKIRSVALQALKNSQGMILPVAIPFVEQHINNDNWRLRDAAVVAIGCILDGSSTSDICQFVCQSIPVLLAAVKDVNQTVRDSATHCIALICTLHMEAVQGKQLTGIIQGLIMKLKEAPLLASHASSAVFNAAMLLKSSALQVTNLLMLSATMLPLEQALLEAIRRENAADKNLRVASMAAAVESVSASATGVKHILRGLLSAITGRMEAVFRTEVLSKKDNEIKEQVMGSLCRLITVLFQRLEKSDSGPYSNQVMELLLKVLRIPNASCHEDAFRSISAVVNAVDDKFVKYLPELMPILTQGLRSYHNHALSIVCVGVVVDVCTAVGQQIQPYCDEIMGALTDCLKDRSAQRDIKPVVISCFGDIAMAISAAYAPYLQTSTMLLMQVAIATPPTDIDGDELTAYIKTLRVSILEAYSGIIFGLADGQVLHLLLENVGSIMKFIELLSKLDSQKDDDVLLKAIHLVGDIAQQMGTQVKQHLCQEFVFRLVQEAVDSTDQQLREAGERARSVIFKLQACSQAEFIIMRC